MLSRLSNCLENEIPCKVLHEDNMEVWWQLLAVLCGGCQPGLRGAIVKENLRKRSEQLLNTLVMDILYAVMFVFEVLVMHEMWLGEQAYFVSWLVPSPCCPNCLLLTRLKFRCLPPFSQGPKSYRQQNSQAGRKPQTQTEDLKDLVMNQLYPAVASDWPGHQSVASVWRTSTRIPVLLLASACQLAGPDAKTASHPTNVAFSFNSIQPENSPFHPPSWKTTTSLFLYNGTPPLPPATLVFQVFWVTLVLV